MAANVNQPVYFGIAGWAVSLQELPGFLSLKTVPVKKDTLCLVNGFLYFHSFYSQSTKQVQCSV